MTDILHILLTYVPSHDHAVSIVNTLLDESLIACANIAPPVESRYIWQNKRCIESEVPIWIKTTASRLDAAKHRLQSLHPYETPALFNWPAHANPDYIAWAQTNTAHSA